jgi:hypothetical protein
MIETIFLALLVAKIRKYKLTPLFKNWTIYLVLLFAVTYIYLDNSIFHGNYSLVKYSSVFKVSYICMLSLLVFIHRQYKAGFIGAACVALGGVLNAIVMNANGGKMPVFPTLSYRTGYLSPDTFLKIAQYEKVHVLGSSATKLSFLADRIDLGYGILSIGDVFTRLMAFVIIFSVIKHLNRRDSAVVHQVI